MKRKKLVLTAMVLVAIVVLYVGCPNESSDSGGSSTLVNTFIESPTIGSMVLVAGGSFERPVKHDDTTSDSYTITLSPFYMGTTEVTKKQYSDVMNIANPSNPAKEYNYPVTGVTWLDAVKFCNALTTKENDLTAEESKKRKLYYENTDSAANVKIVEGANGYRLATEAEWEYAAKGGQHKSAHGFTYSGTSNATTDTAGADHLSKYAVYGGSNAGVSSAATVKSKLPNALGLYDMSGNVWELCWDRWDGTASYPASHQKNPTGHTMPTDSPRVARGGGFFLDDANYCSVANRNYISQNSSAAALGFRVVRSLLP